MTEFTRRVAANTDDAQAWDWIDEEYGEINEWETGNPFIAFDDHPDTDPYYIEAGTRFTNVTIPKNASITSAKVTFVKYFFCSDDTTIRIRGEIGATNENPATFSTRGDFDGRSRTSAYVDWVIADDTWYEDSPPYTPADTADFAAVIQEIVNRANWASGNALVLFWLGDSIAEDGCRAGWSYDGDPDNCFLLTVEYEEGLSEAPLPMFFRPT